MSTQLFCGDCLDVMPTLAPHSVDAIVTDPPYGLSFMGSGSTGKAAMLEGFSFIGIEKDSEYLEIARRRIEAAQTQMPPPETELQLPLLELT